MTATKFAGRSPFEPKPKRTKAPNKEVDISTLTIADDPLPGARAKVGEYKYDPLFAKMKPGQCLKCAPGDTSKISHAMSVWIKRTGLKDHVSRSTRSYEADGQGRVWLVDLGKKGGAA